MGTARPTSTLGITLQRLYNHVNLLEGITKDVTELAAGDIMPAYELIGRLLWRNTDLVGSYVRDNPDGLSPAQLQEVAHLSDAIYGDFLLWKNQDNQAMLLHPCGAFDVIDTLGFIPRMDEDCCLMVRGAISSYQGSVVAVMPFTVLGRGGEQTWAHMVDELAAHGREEPIRDAKEFARRAIAWQVHSAPKEPEAPSHPVTGFHKGALAGLAGAERRLAQQARFDEQALNDAGFRLTMEARAVPAHLFPMTLEEGLELLDDDWLVDIVQDLDDSRPTSDIPRAELIELICTQMPRDANRRDTALMWCRNAQFRMLQRLMQTNPLPLGTLSPTDALGLYPMVPYLFILQEDGAFVAWMPPEIRTLVAQVDLACVAKARAQLEEVRRAADALATTCGIIRLDVAYGHYRHLAQDPLDEQQFRLALMELEDCSRRDSYALWEHDGISYLVCVEISDASAPARVVREAYADHVIDAAATSPSGEPTFVTLSIEEEHDFEERIEHLEQRLQEARVGLLACQHEKPHPLSPDMLAAHPIDTLLETPRLQELRAFVDEHIPDGEDDYAFADDVTRAVVVSSLLMEESYDETLDLVRLFGLQHCEGTDFSDTMGRLVTNAFNALPRWALSGWSLEERTERLTGRRRFFNPDGTIAHVSDETACPCGSGRPYGSCCGNLAERLAS